MSSDSQTVPASSSLDVKETWYSNMHLLGFKATLYETYTVAFDKDMFVHINKKGSELMLHFLLSKLDSRFAYEEFRNCWPVFDKKQEQQFRKACSNWIAKVAKEDPSSKLPRISASLLLSPGGDKFYLFLLRLSTYVLRHKCLEEAKSVEKSVFLSSFVTSGKGLLDLQASQKETVHYAVQAHTVRHCDSIQHRAQLACAMHDKWESYASQLIQEYRELVKKSRSITKKLLALEEEKTQFLSHRIRHNTTAGNQPANSRVLSVAAEVNNRQRNARIHKVRDMWKALEKFVKATESHRDMVDCIVHGKANQYSISAKDITMQIPDVVVKEYECLSREGKASNTYQAGKYNLICLIQMWKCSLRLLRNEMLKGSGVPSFEAEQDYAMSELQAHRAHLTAARNLRASLSSLRSSLEASIVQLESELRNNTTFSTFAPVHHSSALSSPSLSSPMVLKTAKDTSSCTLPQFLIPSVTIPTLDLGLLPPTPPVKKMELNTPDTKSRLPKLSFATCEVSTPKAVEELSFSILQNSRLRQKDSGPSLTGSRSERPFEKNRSIGLSVSSHHSGDGKHTTSIGSSVSSLLYDERKRFSGRVAGHSLVSSSGRTVSVTATEGLSKKCATSGTPVRPGVSRKRKIRGTHVDGSTPKGVNFPTPTTSYLEETNPDSKAPSQRGSGHNSLPPPSGGRLPQQEEVTTSSTAVSPPHWTSALPSSPTSIADGSRTAVSSYQPKSLSSAHEILADQIAAAVSTLSESNGSFQSEATPPAPLHSLHETVAAMRTDAFISRDVIQRTPMSTRARPALTRGTVGDGREETVEEDLSGSQSWNGGRGGIGDTSAKFEVPRVKAEDTISSHSISITDKMKNAEIEEEEEQKRNGSEEIEEEEEDGEEIENEEEVEEDGEEKLEDEEGEIEDKEEKESIEEEEVEEGCDEEQDDDDDDIRSTESLTNSSIENNLEHSLRGQSPASSIKDQQDVTNTPTTLSRHWLTDDTQQLLFTTATPKLPGLSDAAFSSPAQNLTFTKLKRNQENEEPNTLSHHQYMSTPAQLQQSHFSFLEDVEPPTPYKMVGFDLDSPLVSAGKEGGSFYHGTPSGSLSQPGDEDMVTMEASGVHQVTPVSTRRREERATEMAESLIDLSTPGRPGGGASKPLMASTAGIDSGLPKYLYPSGGNNASWTGNTPSTHNPWLATSSSMELGMFADSGSPALVSASDSTSLLSLSGLDSPDQPQ